MCQYFKWYMSMGGLLYIEGEDLSYFLVWGDAPWLCGLYYCCWRGVWSSMLLSIDFGSTLVGWYVEVDSWAITSPPGFLCPEAQPSLKLCWPLWIWSISAFWRPFSVFFMGLLQKNKEINIWYYNLYVPPIVLYLTPPSGLSLSLNMAKLYSELWV